MFHEGIFLLRGLEILRMEVVILLKVMFSVWFNIPNEPGKVIIVHLKVRLMGMRVVNDCLCQIRCDIKTSEVEAAVLEIDKGEF